MKQKIEQRYAVITAKSDDEITNKINLFCSRHKANNVKVTTCDHNLEGTGIRSQNYILMYTATIAYDVDVIKEAIEDEITTVLANHFKDTRPPHNLLGDRDLIDKWQKEQISQYMKSDEFKEIEKQIKQKYENE